MSKFENVAINYQLDSRTKEEALDNFKKSCDICCMRGILHTDCERCVVEIYHKMIVASFEDKTA